MDIRTHLRLIWRYRLQIVGLSLLMAAAVFFLTSGTDDRFTADARLQVVTETGSGSPAERAIFLANSYAELGETTPVLQAAITAGNLDITVRDLRHQVDVVAPDDLGFVRISAEAGSETEATAIVSSMVTAITTEVNDRAVAQYRAQLEPLEARIAELRTEIAAAPTNSIEASVLTSELDAVVATRSNLAAAPLDRLLVVEPPLGSAAPIPSGAVGTTLTALIVALVVNAELAVGLHLLADRLFLDDLDDVEVVTGLPVLATIAARDSRAAGEAFRQLRLAMSLRTGERPIRRLAVVGAGPAGVRADVSTGIAGATADLGVPVTVVDADLRQPSIHDRYDMSRQPGLGDYTRENGVNGLIRRVENAPHLRLFSAGRPVDDPGRFIALHLDAMLHAISDTATLVVNTPDAGEWSDAGAIAARCDAWVLVLTAGARRRATRSLAAQLRSYGAHPIGVVIHTGTR